ncbi:hypothetical protein QVD17_25332 [Tagetes erecta]|uniref:Transmembrane protein n=1 Tax=Tagetes erecta TaxID=13708 RepID=A0AAD8KGE7_TARER|nr:hypothetical protein QVD17_25332 [Tagetes erecta]
METTTKIIRTSIHTFFQHYIFFTTIATLAIPFSTTILLLSSTLFPNFLPFHSLLQLLFDTAGFPQESHFFQILNLKLSQTISSSISTLPFSLTFLLITKSFIIQSFHIRKPPPSIPKIFTSILQTQLCNTFFIISSNATCFWILFITFNSLKTLQIPSLFLTIFGAIAYSIVIANTLIIFNLTLIISGMELKSGFISLLKSCVLIRGRTSTALLLSLPINTTLAGIELLFQFRIIKAYSNSGVHQVKLTMILEGLFIAYLYCVVIIIDVVIGCVFFKSCKIGYDQNIVDQEACRINEEDEVALVKCLEKDFC